MKKIENQELESPKMIAIRKKAAHLFESKIKIPELLTFIYRCNEHTVLAQSKYLSLANDMLFLFLPNLLRCTDKQQYRSYLETELIEFICCWSNTNPSGELGKMASEFGQQVAKYGYDTEYMDEYLKVFVVFAKIICLVNEYEEEKIIFKEYLEDSKTAAWQMNLIMTFLKP